MNKGTIIYIGGFELPDRNAAAQRVLANSSIFKVLGYEVVFIGTSKSMEETGTDRPLLSSEYTCYNVLYPKSISDRIIYLTNISLFKDVMSLYKDVRAVICYNYQAIALWKIKRYCNKHNIKVIGDTTEWYKPMGSFLYRVIKNLDTNLRMYIIQPKLDGLIPTSKFLHDFYYGKNPNLLILPALVDLNDKKWDVEVEPHNENVIRLIYAGSTGIGKDELACTINILSILKKRYDHKFIFKIIGMTIEEYYQSFEVNDIPIEIKDNIKFMGRLPHEEVIKAVSNSDFYIFIRKKSIVTLAGFPTKFSESISSGTPVITTNTSDLEEYIIEGKNGFFIDINCEENAIEKMNMILTMSVEKVIEMKDYCKKSELMNYANFIMQTREFFNNLGV